MAFDELKGVLTLDLSLTHFGSKLDITLATGASDCSAGVVIQHKCDDGSKEAI